VTLTIAAAATAAARRSRNSRKTNEADEHGGIPNIKIGDDKEEIET